jgi:hypothetical protein
VAAGSVLFAGHFLEVPLGFHLCSGRGRAPGTDLIYFALGNYHHAGLQRRAAARALALLGPMTALNGIMLIGWSTGADLRHPAARSV